VYAYFESFMYGRAGAVAHEISKGGAVMNESCDVCVDAAAFGETDVRHIQVGAWDVGLYMSKVGVYGVHRWME